MTVTMESRILELEIQFNMVANIIQLGANTDEILCAIVDYLELPPLCKERLHLEYGNSRSLIDAAGTKTPKIKPRAILLTNAIRAMKITKVILLLGGDQETILNAVAMHVLGFALGNAEINKIHNVIREASDIVYKRMVNAK